MRAAQIPAQPHPRRVSSVSTATIEAPAGSRMRRGFVTFWQANWNERLTDHGRTFVQLLVAIPGLAFTVTIVALVLAPLLSGVPA